MTLEIKNTTNPNEIDVMLSEIKNIHKGKGLRKHFGRLKRNIEAVSHQKELRNEWN